MTQRLLLAILWLTIACFPVSAGKCFTLCSPDGSLETEVSVSDGRVTYSVSKDAVALLSPSEIALHLSDGSHYDGKVRFLGTRRTSADRMLPSQFYKKSSVHEHYNELVLRFRTYELVFRAYDSGICYRFVSKSTVPFNVSGETASFCFPGDWDMHVPYVSGSHDSLESQYFNSFENTYEHCTLSGWDAGRLAFLPLMVSSPDGHRINIMESALMDYPGMFLYNGDGDSCLEGRFAPVPREVVQGGHNSLQGIVRSREDYIASCLPGTSFPWRIVSVSREDREMLDNDLVWLLGEPSDPSADWSWVRPGKVAWEWWNNWHVTGVDFKAGVNNETYMYYIDFASRHGIEYVILDEGWAVKGKADLFDVVPSIDIASLVSYAAERNVGIVLWAGYWAFERDMERVCDYYSRLGVKGWKIDFMDRDDQKMVSFYRRAAETAARHHQFVDFHGGFKPCGLNRTYPNVLNYEGVHGMEQMKWSKAGTDQITYDVTFPYIRMACGPVDYTQGAMKNSSYRWYKPNYVDPVSQGTRCHQLGMYVVFESPFNMLCDAPQYYDREAECTDFIASVPTVWDETVAVDGKVGDYIVIARRAGDVWYVGGLCGHESRTLDVDPSFLGTGDWEVEMFSDGANAGRHAEDYRRTVFNADGILNVQMASGGGFAARISRKYEK